MQPFFHIPNNVVISTVWATWSGLPIANAYIAGAAVWSAKAVTTANTFTGAQNITVAAPQLQVGYSSTIYFRVSVAADGSVTLGNDPTAVPNDFRLPRQQHVSGDSILTRDFAASPHSTARTIALLGL